MTRRLISSGSTFEEEIGYSRAVVDGDWVFVSGTTGFDYATMTIADDVVAQAEQCLKNIDAALREAGASMADVVRVTYVLPDAAEFADCAIEDEMDKALDGADVVIMLRIQRERIEHLPDLDADSYHARYGLTGARLARAKPDALVMHPRPINRGVEIASDVADGAQSAILDQVANGVFVRMAALAQLLER